MPEAVEANWECSGETLIIHYSLGCKSTHPPPRLLFTQSTMTMDIRVKTESRSHCACGRWCCSTPTLTRETMKSTQLITEHPRLLHMWISLLGEKSGPAKTGPAGPGQIFFGRTLCTTARAQIYTWHHAPYSWTLVPVRPEAWTYLRSSPRSQYYAISSSLLQLAVV